VINKKGKISRYAVNHMKEVWEQSFWYLSINFLPPFIGLEKLPFWSRSYFSAHLIASIEWGEGSLAHEVLDLIEKSVELYPLRHTYRFIWPNSNTYAQWILDNSPGWKVNLPWNSFGKDFGK
jgi:hypothetical protein